MPASLRQIAKIAKTSDMTVSRALRGESNVRPELRDRVLTIAKELRYEKNLLVGGVLSKRSHNVAVLVPDISDRGCSLVVRGVQDGLKLRGYRAFVFNSDGDPHVEFDEIRQAAMRRVDGLLLMTNQNVEENSNFKEISLRRIPTVLIGRPRNNKSFEVFANDDENQSRQIVQKMIEKGHRRIAHIGIIEDEALSSCHKAGWQRALLAAGLNPDDMPIFHAACTEVNAVAEQVERWFSSALRPTAVFTSTDTHAAGVYRAAQKLGICIGKECSVASFFDTTQCHMNPSLAGFLVPNYEIGRLASIRLVDMIENEEDLSIDDRCGKINQISAVWNEGESLVCVA